MREPGFPGQRPSSSRLTSPHKPDEHNRPSAPRHDGKLAQPYEFRNLPGTRRGAFQIAHRFLTAACKPPLLEKFGTHGSAEARPSVQGRNNLRHTLAFIRFNTKSPLQGDGL